MPQTDAELIAYRWGQTVGAAEVVATFPTDTVGPPPAAWPWLNQQAALTRLGRRRFRYWALRGATSLPPAG